MNLSSSAKHQRPLRSRQSPELGGSSSTPRSTSGACTPTSPGPAPSAFSSFWGGLVRRFSGESAPKYYETSSERHHRRNGTADAVLTKSSRTRTPSPEGGKLTLPPLPPLELVGFAEDTAPSARLLTVQVAEEIRIMVPARLSIIEQWKLVYSLDQDGASLATLYDKCSRYQGKRVGFVLCVRDAGGGVRFTYFTFSSPSLCLLLVC
jgi:Oxidation resistance protein